MKQFILQYLPYYKNYKKQIFFALLGMIMVAVGTSGTAYVIKPILDDIFIKKDEEMLKLLPFLVVMLFSVKGIGRYLEQYYVAHIGGDIIRIVRDKFLSHILSQDIGFFHKRHGGELLSRVITDIGAIQKAVSQDVSVMLMNIFTIIALLGVVIYQSPKLAFYGLVVLPLIIYPLIKLAKKMKKISHKAQETAALMNSELNETFNNIELIIANNGQDMKCKTFGDINQDFFSITMKTIKNNALVSPLTEIIGAFAAALVIGMGGMEVINGNMSVGSFFSFLTALFMLYTPIKTFSSFYNSFQTTLAINERINSIFDIKSDIVNGSGKIKEDIKSIKFKDVVLKYDDKIALNHINLDAKKGDKIALVGDSGGGKSSLVNLLLRFYDPNQGEILFNDTNINSIDLKKLRDSISIVTQRVYIFNDTIASNIVFGEEIDEQKIKDVLKQAHALDFVEKLPNGIYTTLDEFGSNLSGGQRQRIAIARALYKEPQILIFDEATSALDNESESIITDVLDEVSKNKITFVIAHRLSTIKNATKIAVFKDGNIICQGSQDELLDSCDEYQRLYNLSR